MITFIWNIQNKQIDRDKSRLGVVSGWGRGEEGGASDEYGVLHGGDVPFWNETVLVAQLRE